jgi:hypothetical protein
MKKRFAATLILSLATLFSASAPAQSRPPFSEFIKNKTTSYQIQFQQQDSTFGPMKVTKCVEGLVRDDFKQHPDKTYNYEGALQVAGTPELLATIKISAGLNDTADLETWAAFHPANGKNGVAYPIGGNIIAYGIKLQGLMGTSGKVLEDGTAYRDYDNANDTRKLYLVEIVLNPRVDCAGHVK